MDFLTRRPKKVCMVGLGPSANAYWLEVAQWNTPLPWDEVWVVNRAASAFHHDVAWNMHDLRTLTREHPNERLRLLDARTPIVTVKAYPEFPTSIEYPIKDVLEFIQHDILNSTPAYMVAYALMIGVKEMWLYGKDFHYVNLDRAEAGGQGMAYLLGMAQAMGVQYRIPNTSSLLDAYKVRLVEVDGKQVPMRPLYGYDDSLDPRIPQGAKVITLRPAAPQQMTAHDPRYALGEAEEGDKVRSA